MGYASCNFKLSIFKTFSEFSGENRPLIGCVNGDQGCVHLWVDHEIIRNLASKAEIIAAAKRWSQESTPTFYRGVGMGKIRCVENRHPEHFKEGVLVFDIVGLVVVNHLIGLDLPERWPLGVLFTYFTG